MWIESKPCLQRWFYCQAALANAYSPWLMFRTHAEGEHFYGQESQARTPATLS
jgi:hypothetical protein